MGKLRTKGRVTCQGHRVQCDKACSPQSQASAFLTTPQSETKTLHFPNAEKETSKQENVVT